jgi:lipase
LRLHLREWGDGPLVVCLHGVTSFGGRFRKLAEERLADFRVLAPDLRGHGRSEIEPPWDLRTIVGDILETLPAGPAAWIGHSYGGRIVLEIGARAPERVERVVLLDPALQVLPHVALDMAEGTCADLSFASPDDAIQSRIDSGRYPHTPREFFEEDAREHLEAGPDGRLRFRFCRSAVVTAWSDMATPHPPAPRVPTLLVLGAQSWLVLDEQVEELRARLGELLQVATVPGGHTVFWDAFAETADAVDGFLRARVP